VPATANDIYDPRARHASEPAGRPVQCHRVAQPSLQKRIGRRASWSSSRALTGIRQPRDGRRDRELGPWRASPFFTRRSRSRVGTLHERAYAVSALRSRPGHGGGQGRDDRAARERIAVWAARDQRGGRSRSSTRGPLAAPADAMVFDHLANPTLPAGSSMVSCDSPRPCRPRPAPGSISRRVLETARSAAVLPRRRRPRGLVKAGALSAWCGGATGRIRPARRQQADDALLFDLLAEWLRTRRRGTDPGEIEALYASRLRRLRRLQL